MQFNLKNTNEILSEQINENITKILAKYKNFSDKTMFNILLSKKVEEKSKSAWFGLSKTKWKNLTFTFTQINELQANLMGFLAQFGVEQDKNSDKFGQLTEEGLKKYKEVMGQAYSLFDEMARVQAEANGNLDEYLLQNAQKNKADYLKTIKEQYGEQFKQLGLNLDNISLKNIANYFNKDTMEYLIGTLGSKFNVDNFTQLFGGLENALKSLADTTKKTTDKIVDTMRSLLDYSASLHNMVAASYQTTDKLSTFGKSTTDTRFYYLTRFNEAYDTTKSLVESEAEISKVQTQYTKLQQYVNTLLDNNLITDASQLNSQFSAINNYIDSAADALKVKVVNATEVAGDAITQDQLKELGLAKDESITTSESLDKLLEKIKPEAYIMNTSEDVASKIINNVAQNVSAKEVEQAVKSTAHSTVESHKKTFADVPKAIIHDSADGAVSSIKKIFHFADGGIVTAPTLGLIGEAGYNEAIVPLKNPNDPLNQNEVIRELRELRKSNELMRKQQVELLKAINNNTDTYEPVERAIS